MEHGDNQITVVDEDGKEQLYTILTTFDLEEFGKSYVLYYPADADENGDDEIEIHASAFVPGEEGKAGDLIPIETDEEWDRIEEILGAFLDEQEDHED
ncbi:hypothetical protein AM500_08715 [Bacillus sp. FJAT-18017]|jgi:uncharacterized protein YrzB (UPF0473 family)|uniref:DUF1292 domain-containing protein n=1 Tax=unclassified Bacillus (in: firmicutes) TaxID=185979 RepID=UPI0005C5265E|nr:MULTISPECIES: DUF1292 domain-containing protein [unclassified Bacillus (in: firmicutes)]ALC89844.1 hypothetical protein AM500_08715 [Bacillus sp. FJAT-18017]